MNKGICSSLIAFAIASLLLITGCQNSTKGQLRHVVAFKYKPYATQEQIAQVNKEFSELKNRIPGIVSFEYGLNDSPEKRDLGFTHVYLITFENAEARDKYLPHPKHKEFGEFLSKLNILDDVFVVDYVPEMQ